jgi:hypothetical protein
LVGGVGVVLRAAGVTEGLALAAAGAALDAAGLVLAAGLALPAAGAALDAAGFLLAPAAAGALEAAGAADGSGAPPMVVGAPGARYSGTGGLGATAGPDTGTRNAASAAARSSTGVASSLMSSNPSAATEEISLAIMARDASARIRRSCMVMGALDGVDEGEEANRAMIE